MSTRPVGPRRQTPPVPPLPKKHAGDRRNPTLALHDALIAELAWFIERNHLNGTPPDDKGATYEGLAARLPGYVQATKVVRNLAAAIRDLRDVS